MAENEKPKIQTLHPPEPIREVTQFMEGIISIKHILSYVTRVPVLDVHSQYEVIVNIQDRSAFYELQQTLMHNMKPWMIGDPTIMSPGLYYDEFIFMGWKFRWSGSGRFRSPGS